MTAALTDISVRAERVWQVFFIRLIHIFHTSLIWTGTRIVPIIYGFWSFILCSGKAAIERFAKNQDCRMGSIKCKATIYIFIVNYRNGPLFYFLLSPRHPFPDLSLEEALFGCGTETLFVFSGQICRLLWTRGNRFYSKTSICQKLASSQSIHVCLELWHMPDSRRGILTDRRQTEREKG